MNDIEICILCKSLKSTFLDYIKVHCGELIHPNFKGKYSIRFYVKIEKLGLYWKLVFCFPISFLFELLLVSFLFANGYLQNNMLLIITFYNCGPMVKIRLSFPKGTGFECY